MEKYPKTVKLSEVDFDSIIGLFVLHFVEDKEEVAEILKHGKNESGDKILTVRVVTGLQKDSVYEGKYNPEQEIIVYDEKTKISALLKC